MIRYLLAAILLAFPAYAQTTHIYPPLDSQSLKNPPGGAGGGGTAAPYVLLTPTGSPIQDTANMEREAANSATVPVVLGLGIFQICSQIEVPRYGHILGIGTTNWTGGGSPGLTPPRPWPASTLVLCNDPAAFNSTLPFGFFHLHDQTIIEGFAIQGNRQLGSSHPVSCINAQNSASSLIQNMQLVDCTTSDHTNGYGIDVRANGDLPGDVGTTPIGISILHNSFWYGGTGIIGNAYAGSTPGSGCSDMKVVDNWFEVPWNNGLDWDCGQSQIIGNRIEDGGGGMVIRNNINCCVIIANNLMNRITGITLDTSGYAITIIGNKWSGTEPPSDIGQHFIEITSGHSPNIISRGNTGAYDIPSGFYAIDSGSGSGMSGSVDDMVNTGGGNLMYADVNTESIIDPLRTNHPTAWVNIPVTGSTFTAPDWQNGLNQSFTLPHGVNTVPNPVYTASGQTANLQIIQSPVGGDSITWGNKYLNTPSLTSTAYAINYCPLITDLSGNMVFQTCSSLVPSANLVTTGGNAMTAGWTVNGVKPLATNTVTDPVGTLTGAAVTENSSASAAHGVSYAFGTPLAAGRYTCSFWLRAGTSNDRNIAIVASASTSDKYIFVAYDIHSGAVTDAYTNNPGGVSPAIYAAGVAATLGGYFRAYVTFDEGADTVTGLTAFLLAGIDHGVGSWIYSGNNTSNNNVWGPVCRAGAAP